ncbi:hypothetical protein FJT64_022648 [Amphibalanus amphitrite]|uniref:Uncharacterized protein n=1 Tax=Amphibalanus amphitrite TaxID=1232801 RepID=A0A6A4WI80_AMPAM|nr:hypothetical protein FJT64_022648 [Amphibalanus amphitrite]
MTPSLDRTRRHLAAMTELTAAAAGDSSTWHFWENRKWTGSTAVCRGRPVRMRCREKMRLKTSLPLMSPLSAICSKQEIQRETQAARRPFIARRSRDDSSQATDDDQQTLSMDEAVPPIAEKYEHEAKAVTTTSDVIESLGTSSKYEAAETEKGSSSEVEEATHAIVEKRMRTDIVMEEMGQSLESQSPERKRLLTPEEELARQQELAASAVVVSESQAADEEDPEAYEAKEFCTEEYSEAECAEEEEAERKMLAEDDEERQKIQEDEVRSETQPNILDEIETKSFVSDTQNDILDVTEEHAPESEVLDYQEPSIREPDVRAGAS